MHGAHALRDRRKVWKSGRGDVVRWWTYSDLVDIGLTDISKSWGLRAPRSQTQFRQPCLVTAELHQAASHIFQRNFRLLFNETLAQLIQNQSDNITKAHSWVPSFPPKMSRLFRDARKLPYYIESSGFMIEVSSAIRKKWIHFAWKGFINAVAFFNVTFLSCGIFPSLSFSTDPWFMSTK